MESSEKVIFEITKEHPAHEHTIKGFSEIVSLKGGFSVVNVTRIETKISNRSLLDTNTLAIYLYSDNLREPFGSKLIAKDFIFYFTGDKKIQFVQTLWNGEPMPFYKFQYA